MTDKEIAQSYIHVGYVSNSILKTGANVSNNGPMKGESVDHWEGYQRGLWLANQELMLCAADRLLDLRLVPNPRGGIGKAGTAADDPDFGQCSCCERQVAATVNVYNCIGSDPAYVCEDCLLKALFTLRQKIDQAS